jgi:hypothetical protein
VISEFAFGSKTESSSTAHSESHQRSFKPNSRNFSQHVCACGPRRQYFYRSRPAELKIRTL